MDNGEAAQLLLHTARFAGNRQNALVFLVLTLVGAAGVFVSLFHGIHREMLARAKADKRVHRLNADLERRVEERTAALEDNQRSLGHTRDMLLGASLTPMRTFDRKGQNSTVTMSESA